MNELLNKIFNEDCLETMRRMPENFIDLTVTSPPYDNLRTYNGYSFDFEGIAKELYRVTKPGGVVVWVVGDATIKGSETLTSFKQALYFKEIGFNVHDTMIYERVCPTWNVTSKRYRHNHEYIFIISKGSPKTFNPIKDIPVKNLKTRKIKRNRNGIVGYDIWTPKNAYTVRGNIWKYGVGSGSSTDKIAFQHPAIFPEQLAHDHIYSWSNEGAIVYDPFGGSGTTAKMAEKLNRNWIVSEISSQYCEIIQKRVNLAINA